MVVPSAYPTFHSPVDGIFVHAQAAGLAAAGVRTGVVYADGRSLRTLAAGRLLKSRFQIEVRREQEIETVRLQGWNVPFLRLGPRLWKRLALRGFGAYVRGFGKPELCHAHNSLWAGAVAREIKKQFGVPYVLTEHSSAYVRKLVRTDEEEVTRQVYADAAQVVAVSRWLGDGLQRYARKEIRVIPNIVDTDFFTLPPTPRRTRPFRFLAVALLTPVKRIDLLLRAFSQAFSQQGEVELEIAGDGPEGPRLEELARSLGICERVTFSRLRTREQVRESMWRSNALVTASQVETFGIVLGEALACGLPVISTKCGGPEEIVSSGVGILVDAGSVEGLAGGLEEMFRNADSCDPSVQRQRAVERYSERVVVTRLQNLYQTVLCR